MSKTAKEILNLLLSMDSGDDGSKARARAEFEKILKNGEFEAAVPQLAEEFQTGDEKTKTYITWALYLAAQEKIDISLATDALLESIYKGGSKTFRDSVAFALAAIMLQRGELKEIILDEVVIGLTNKDLLTNLTCLRILQILTTEGFKDFRKKINSKFEIDLSGEVPLLKRLMENENENIRDYATDILGATTEDEDPDLIQKLSKNLDDTYSLERLAEMGEKGADLSSILEKVAKYLNSAYDDGIFAGRIMKAAVESGKGRDKTVEIIGKMIKSTKTSPNGLVLCLDLLQIASENGINISKFIPDVAECLSIVYADNVRRAAYTALKKFEKEVDAKTNKKIKEALKQAEK